MGESVGHVKYWTLAQYWLTCASTGALICASTCASTCALRISYLRAYAWSFLEITVYDLLELANIRGSSSIKVILGEDSIAELPSLPFCNIMYCHYKSPRIFMNHEHSPCFAIHFVEFVEFFSSLVTSSSAWTLQGFSRTRIPACALQGWGLPKSFPSSKSLLMKRGKLVESKDEQSKPSWKNKRIFYRIVWKESVCLAL